MNDVVLYPSKKKLILVFFAALLFFGFGLYFVVTEGVFSKHSWCFLFALILGVIGIIQISYLLFVKCNPRVILNNQGLRAQGCPFITWENVRNVYIKKIKTETYVCIAPYNEQALSLDEFGFARKFLLSMNQALIGTMIYIPMTGLSTSQDELLALINEFKQQSTTKQL